MIMYRRSTEFNITTLIEDYQGEELETLFSDHRYIENKMGRFTEFSWDYEEFPCNLPISQTKKKLIKNLKLIYNIGEITEKEFHKRGMVTLTDLQNHLRFGKSAKKILSYIKNKTYPQLLRNRYIYDIDVSFCFNLTDFLFLDIETLGLYDSPIIMIGFGYFTKDHGFHIRVLFANKLESEMALCEHFRQEIMPQFKCFVTYNGKSFDIPYISNRLLYFFDENPMIGESDTPYEDINTKYHHIDLYHNCRRVFKQKYQDFTLTNMERILLNSKRDNELPSNLVGLCYRRYKKNPNRYVGLIKKSIEHNYEDIRSLPLIFQKLLNHN
ncbi:MAG: ribonuclease H-like domain-containing protein [Promethearchaeia archaeon]